HRGCGGEGLADDRFTQHTTVPVEGVLHRPAAHGGEHMQAFDGRGSGLEVLTAEGDGDGDGMPFVGQGVLGELDDFSQVVLGGVQLSFVDDIQVVPGAGVCDPALAGLGKGQNKHPVIAKVGGHTQPVDALVVDGAHPVDAVAVYSINQLAVDGVADGGCLYLAFNG